MNRAEALAYQQKRKNQQPAENTNTNSYANATNTGTTAGSQAAIGNIISGQLGGQSVNEGIGGLGGFASYINGQDYSPNAAPSVSDILANPELQAQYDDLYSQYTAATDPSAPATTANRGGFIDYKTKQGRKAVLDYIYDLIDNKSLTEAEQDEVIKFVMDNAGIDSDAFGEEILGYERDRVVNKLKDKGLTATENPEDRSNVVNNAASDIVGKLINDDEYTVKSAYEEIEKLQEEYKLSDEEIDYLYNAINGDPNLSGFTLDKPEDTGLTNAQIIDIEEMAKKHWDDMNDDEKIYYHAKQSLKDLYFQYGNMWEKARKDPTDPNHELAMQVTDKQNFVEQMLAGDPTLNTLLEAISGYEENNKDNTDEYVRAAFEAAAKVSAEEDYEERRHTNTMTNEDLTKQALEAGGSLDAIAYGNNDMNAPSSGTAKTEYDYQSLDYSANPFENTWRNKADYETYEQAAMRAAAMGLAPNTPEYANKVKEIFLDIKNGNYRKYLG